MSEIIKPWQLEAYPDPDTGLQIQADIKNGIRYNYDPLFDWRPLPNQKLATIEIDSRGLRSQAGDAPGKYRILLLGGSFAWGYGASSNRATPGGLIQEMLRKRGVDAEIINLADQNYNSIHEIRSFVFSVTDLKPHAVIAITGHNDISTAFTNLSNFNRRSREIMRFVNWGIRTGIINEKSKLKMLWKVLAHFGERLDDEGSRARKPFAERQRDEVPEYLCRNKIDVIGNYCKATGIKAAFILQPTLYTRRAATANEQAYVRAFVSDRFEFYRDHLTALRKEIWADAALQARLGDGIRFIDATEYYDDLDQTIYLDAAHPSDNGYRIFAEKLVHDLSPFFADKRA